MKPLIMLALAVACVGYNAFSQQKEVSNAGLQLPYKMQLNNVSFGDSIYVEKVLWYWKEYCDNQMEKSADLFANDVVAIFPSGEIFKGKEMLIRGGQQYRDLFASITSEITACLALKSPDDPEHQIVTIWGIETDTAKDGRMTKAYINEVYTFNKEGKVVEMHQLRAEKKETRN